MPAPTAHRLPAVDAYIAKSAPFAQPILMHLRELLHLGAPGVEEQIKWSRPFFVYHGIILGNLSAFKAHCSFGLWGKQLATQLRADGVASSEGMGTFGRITSLQDLPPRSQLLAYIQQAAQLIASGERTVSYTRPKVVKAAVAVPPALTLALQKNKKAAAAFEKLSPSCRREYCTWIAEARRDETRDKRIATALPWIAEGKSRNWKYETR